MTRQQSRPGLDPQAARVSVSGAGDRLPAELAHLYGAGVSQAELRMQVRRGLQVLADAWPEMFAQIVRRALAQAFLEGTVAYWLRRAETFEAVGTASADESAKSCRRHGWLLAQGLPHDLAAEVDEALDAILAGEVV